jgi:type III pantothenate kinase
MRQLITVDCGNTTIDVVDHRCGARQWFDSNPAAREPLSELLRAASGCRIVVSSVTESSVRVLADAAANASMSLELAGKHLPCPIPLDYQPASALGSDRWLGAMAAFRMHAACIIVDCGSATTINCIDNQGVFRGGAIAPGLGAIARGMAVATPGLPAADLDGCAEVPARSPDRAVTAGVLLGYAGMVERLVASCFAVNRSCARVVLTGGNAGRLVRWTRLRALHVPDLVHRGLVELAGAGR